MAFDLNQMQGAAPPPPGLIQGGPPGAAPGMPGMAAGAGPPPGGQPMGGGGEIEDFSVDRIKEELSQADPQMLEQIATMEPQQAITMIMQKILPEIEMGSPESTDQPLALEIAGRVFQAILEKVSEDKGVTILQLNPGLGQLKQQVEQGASQQGLPQGQPPASPMGGPPQGQGNIPVPPGAFAPQGGG